MRSILVANPKGGSGKTTLATNLAGLFAVRGFRVVLADMDRQQSSAGWLKRRPEHAPAIRAWTSATDKRDIKAYDPHWLVVDSPAGLHGDKLADLVRKSELVVVPVAPSAFDMDATFDFLSTLLQQKPVRKGESQVAVVGNRVDPRTLAANELDTFLQSFDLPVLSYLRDTQLYVHCARDGTSIFDMPPSRTGQDLDQWRPIGRWLSRHVGKRGEGD